MNGTKEFRIGLLADTIQEMYTGKNVREYRDTHAFAKAIIVAFGKNGFMGTLMDGGSKWIPTPEYVLNHMNDIQNELARQKTPFGYYREQGEFVGAWKFLTKEECVAMMSRNHADIRTRTEHHNDRLENIGVRWHLGLPAITEVPALPSP
jgi:hypothetical protein